MKTILFATGIECSQPRVKCKESGGGRRRDQLADTKHYEHWRRDLELCREIGATVVRYGIPYYRMHKGPGKYDWSFMDEVIPIMRTLGIRPMMDLCHYGVPDWIGDFQNRDWPELFGQFAGAFAERYPDVCMYTPVNEVLVCATMSALLGIWNECEKSERAWVRSVLNQCKATQRAIEEIVKRNPGAAFFQSEAAQITLEQHPDARPIVDFENQRRFLTFDFMYGKEVDGNMLHFLLDHGASREEYEWLMAHGRGTAKYCVMGMDYYMHNEKVIDRDGKPRTNGVIVGWATVAREYFERYRKPMMLTETNTIGTQDISRCEWLWTMWHNVETLRKEGMPVVGFTWYSLQDQADWDTMLVEQNLNMAEVGLVDMQRNLRDVGFEYQELIRRYNDLPLLESFGLGEMRG